MINDDDRIKDKLINVIDEFCEMLPHELSKLVREQMYIAGGAIVSLTLGRPPVDYDLFIKTDKGRDEFVQEFNRLAEFYSKYELPYDSCIDVRSTTKNGVTVALRTPSGEKVLQIVTRFTGPPVRVFESFDYEHCKCYFDLKDEYLLYDPDLILRKQLVYTGQDSYPVNAVKRMIRFINRGYTIDNENLLRLIERIGDFNLKDEKVRGDQLIGFYGSSME